MIAILQGIKKSYSNSLMIIAAVLSVAVLVSGFVAGGLGDSQASLQKVEAQQLYAERIARLALGLMRETNKQSVKETILTLENSILEMEKSHQLLTKGNGELSAELNQLYFGDEKLDQQIKDYLFSGRQVIAAKKRDDELLMSKTGVVFLNDRPSMLIGKLGQVAKAYRQQADDSGLISLIVTLVVWLLGVALVYGVGLSSFKPIEKILGDTVNTLEKENAEAVKTKEQALELAHNKDRYLASIIEEIRAPIHGVLGMVNLIKQTHSSEQRRYYANKIEAATSTLSHLTKQVSDFSLAASGALVIEKKEFLVLQLIDDVVAVMKPRAKKKQLQMFVRVAMDFPQKILGDENQLRQILFNLLANAIRFTDKGQITLSVRAETQNDNSLTMHISVIDTGPGLTEQQQDRIFHPFEPVAQGEGHVPGGTGLGLTIVKQLLELMNGTIECRSQVGSGTTFTCHLPISVVSHQGPGAAGNQDFIDKLSRLRVLVVDDEPSILDIVSAVLGKVKVHVKTCELAEEAYSYVVHEYQQGYEIDIIITDWEMPGMNGEQMATKIIEYLDSAGVAPPKFILLSAFKAGDSSSYERTMFNSVIKKPFKVPELINNLLIVSQVDFEADSEDVVPLLPLSGKRVLLIEDQQVNQVIVSQMLSGYGMLVDLASTGIEGIRKLTDNDYDIVVTDIQLPLMDGIELTQNIRAIQSWVDLPIIGLSVDDDLALKHRCLNAGMNAYVNKPVKAAQLLDEIVPLVTRDPDSEGDKLEIAPDSVFNIAKALVQFDGNHKLLSVMIKKFIEQFETLEAHVQNLHSANDLDELAYYAHTLKGTSDSLALSHLSYCADTILEGINKDNVETLPHQLDYLSKVWIESKQSMEEYLNNTQARNGV
jgi:signal transduction histidine kinase/CheY-like chemotaxis protein